MINLANIEKSGFRRGEYVGYGAGIVWRIARNGGPWIARPQSPAKAAPVVAGTLRAMSIKLEQVAK